MKRFAGICALMLVACLLFSACNFTTNMSNNTPFAKMSHQAEVEALLTYLSAGDMGKAAEMMHDDKTDTPGLEQISKYFAGRRVSQLDTQSVNAHTVRGSNGTEETEKATFQATLEDGETVYLSVVFFKNAKDQGFTSFQLVLGVI